MTPAERVAQRTWYTLGRANQLRVRFGEESLTDLLLLDMLPHQHTRGFLVVPPTKRDEGWCGADLLVAVRHQTGRWSLYALQAKKLYPEDRYRMLDRVSKSRTQLGKLECFARRYLALPLYLLYNHTNTVEPSEHWHCRQPFAERQLGCTLVPSCHSKAALCVAPRAHSAAIPPSSRLASPAPRRSRYSRGFIHGLRGRWFSSSATRPAPIPL